MAVIEVQNLRKEYGTVTAVDGISFEVGGGEVFGFLGPNGAGKTTTIRTLLGLLSPTAGRASVLGADATDEASLIEAKRSVGYLPADPAFDEGVTGRRILDLHESIKGGSRRSELLESFEPPLDRPVREYSSGNEQKLGIVQAFMHDPDLAILDEPTSGLDPLMQQRFNDYVRAERERGTSVFFSSHVLSEVRQVCDRVGILRDGRLVTTAPIESLLGRSGKLVRARIAGRPPADAFDGEGVHDLERNVLADADRPRAGEGSAVTDVRFTYTGDVNDLLDRLSGYRFLDLDVEEAPLEEIFVRFYGDERDSDASDAGGPGGGSDA